MLSRANRLTAGHQFSEAVRRGRRAGTATVVVHLAPPEPDGGSTPVRAGFVVSKAVGSAVARNRVKRRLRHLARQRLSSLPGSAVLVVRALPPAADASSAQLGADLDRALAKIRRRDERGRAR